MKVIKWGILGCGNIANKFAESAKGLDNIEILAAASKTEGKAENFSDKHSIENYYTDYTQLLKNSDVDAVYIATTHNFHFENVKQVLEAGKHVLCEKPLTVNTAELKVLIKLAKDKNLFLMEGMWTRFLPAVVQLRKWLDEKKIGEIKQIRATFGFKFEFDPEHRLYNLDLAGGALLDAGIYPLSFANMVMKEAPTEIKAMANIGKTGVDEQSSYLFKYKSGVLAMLNATINAPVESRAEVIGTLGKITIPYEFLAADQVWLDIEGQKTIKKLLPIDQEKGFKFEIIAASDSIRDGKIENDVMPISDTLQIMEQIDEIKSQLGLIYSNDRA